MKNRNLSVYLAGAMENAVNLGSKWRDDITPRLKGYGFQVLNPCSFEPRQLESLRPGRLPESFIGRDGSVVKPTHWHMLKLAPRDSRLYRRFRTYMRRIIHYDVGLVRNDVDLVICYWTASTARGAGTHAELTTAVENNIAVYTVVDPGVELPGWIEGCCTYVFQNFEELYVALDEEFGAAIDEPLPKD